MVVAMVASVVFDGLPQWDEEEMFEENSFSEVIWDREASDEPFDERSAPAVSWDEEPIHELHAFEQEGVGGDVPCVFDETSIQVVWDEMPIDSVVHDELLQHIWGREHKNERKKQSVNELDLSSEWLENVESHDNLPMLVDEGECRWASHVGLLEQLASGIGDIGVADYQLSQCMLSNLVVPVMSQDRIKVYEVLNEMQSGICDFSSGGEQQLELYRAEQCTPEVFSLHVTCSEVFEHKTHNLAMQTHQPNNQSGIGIQLGRVILSCKPDGPLVCGAQLWESEYLDCCHTMEVFHEVCCCSCHHGKGCSWFGTSLGESKEIQSKICPSVRWQWDPGIITATAWGQAVFRGVGNVMTRMWPRRSPSIKCQPSLKPKQRIFPIQARQPKGKASNRNQRKRDKGNRRSSSSSRLQRSYPPPIIL